MMRLRACWKRLGRKGVAAVEYALVLPVFLVMVFGIIEVSRLIWYKVSLQRAVAISSRCGALVATGCTTDALIKTKASQSAPGIALATSVFTVAHETCGVRVSASLSFQFLTGFTGLPAQTLASTFCHPKTS